LLDTAQTEQEAYSLGFSIAHAPTQHEAYTWGALYTDDTCIAEYDRKEGRGFAEVDHARVKTLLLLSLQDGASHSVNIPQGATPVFFRRRSVEINPLADESTPRPTVHCIGWKRDDKAVYLFISDDGSTLLSDDLQAV
jgi:hypothetical protein